MTVPAFTVWPEAEPNRAVFAKNWWHLQWLCFKLAWTKQAPFTKRVRASKWIWIFDAQYTAKEIAEIYERLRNELP